MKELDPDYSIEIDNIDKHSWHNLLINFDDASYYQTWSFGEIHRSKGNLSHVLLKKNGSIASMAQLEIIKFFPLRAGIAYLNWGPLWKLKGKNKNLKNLTNMIRALYYEYVKNRGYILRILPRIVDEEDKEKIRQIFKEENFTFRPDPQQTVVMDLTPSLEDLRKNLPQKVRQLLNRVEKENFELIGMVDENNYDVLIKIVEQMRIRKKYFGSDQSEPLFVNKDLPNSLKLKIILVKYENEPIAVLGWNTIGKIGIPLIGATGDKALKLNASLLLYWKMIEYYKIHDFDCCDLAGVNPNKNSGGYFFKKRLAGRNYKETDHYVGQFEACENFLSLITFKTGNLMRESYRFLRFKLT